MVSHTGQVLAPAWPEAGGGHWVKALDETGPLSLGLLSSPEGLIVLLTVTMAETVSPAALAPSFLSVEGLEASSFDGVMSPGFEA